MTEPRPEPRADRVREILDLAFERPSDERAAFVAGASGGDEALREEVLSLLAALEAGGESLEPPPHRGAGHDAAPAEPLTGLSFGPYVVGERIGEGGMGVVYATLDTRLGRTVAVKALPPRLARDPHRRARFQREARLLASLNHPNIASIHEVLETPRGPVMILEFVPGRTLAEEIASRRLSIEESLDIARQIARGLEAAHAAGIVHRDLKPANIKITPDSAAKILDLGVAKREQRAPDAPPTGAGTSPGIIVGTAAYMSPEQARGRPVDRRADLFAFGCVLFEMLAGRRAFDGETASDAAAAVLRADPDWALLPPGTSPSVRRLLARCLEKDPVRRWRDAGDALLELDTPPEDPRASSRRGLGWALVGLLGFAGGAALWAIRTPHAAPSDSRQMRFSIATSALMTPSTGGCAALSPDGTQLVYAALNSHDRWRMFLRPLGSFSPIEIPGVDLAYAPFFSPDGRWIGYGEATDARRLKRVPVAGGPPETITVGFVIGASWGDDGAIVYATEPGLLWRLPARGEDPAPLAQPDTTRELHGQPDVLPGSRDVLFTCWQRQGARFVPRIEALSVADGRRRVLLTDASQPRFASAIGRLCFVRGGSLMSAPLDTARVAITGEPRQIVGLSAEDPTGALAQYSVSRDGTLAIVAGNSLVRKSDLAWFGRDGSRDTVYEGTESIRTLRLSPDGTRLAYTTEPPLADLWIVDLARGASIKLVDGQTAFPVWTPDGSRVAFELSTERGTPRIEWIACDGSGEPEPLYQHPDGVHCFPTGFSPDGRDLLVSYSSGPEDRTDVSIVHLDRDEPAEPLHPTSEDRVGARFSPDGTLIAYTSLETGRVEVYVVPYPARDRKVRVSLAGGERPAWSQDGRLFFRYGPAIYQSRILTTPALSAGVPEVVIDGLPSDRYDPMPDGSRFIMARPRGDWEPETSIDIIVGAFGPR